MSLDFFVIGAQKAGTTSLHAYLVSHPRIVLPKEKEAPFFYDYALYNRGLDWFLGAFFPKKKKGELFGTVSPQYMSYLEVIPRIHKSCPNSKLIVILRDPIERARSHYRMRVQAFGEKRSFEEAIISQLDEEELSASRRAPNPTNSYVVWGEYGRLLTEYLKIFEKKQVHVLFLDDLSVSPQLELEKIYDFLGVDCHGATNTSFRYNAARTSEFSIKTNLANALENDFVKYIGRALVPEVVKRRLVFWSIINRSKPKDKNLMEAKLTLKTKIKLSNVYRNDLISLEACGISNIPWAKDFGDLDYSEIKNV